MKHKKIKNGYEISIYVNDSFFQVFRQKINEKTGKAWQASKCMYAGDSKQKAFRIFLYA